MRFRLSLLVVATLVVCLADERRDAAEKAFKEAEKLMWQRTADSLTRALEQFGKVLVVWEDIGDRKQQGMTLSRMGLTQFFQGNFRPALDHYERALPLLTLAEDQEWNGITLGNIAQVYSVLGEGQKSIDYFERALAVHTRIDNPRGQGVVLTNLGWVYLAVGESDKGLELCLKALPHHRTAGNSAGEADALNNIALAYRQKGDFARSAEYAMKALAIHRAVGNRPGESSSLGSLATTNQHKGDLIKAIEYSRGALDVVRRTGNLRAEAVELDRLALLLNKTGRPAEALEQSSQALRLSRSVGSPPDESSALTEMARSHLLLGEPEKARPLAEEAVRLSESVRGSFLDLNLRASYLGRSRETFELLIESLMQMHRARPKEGLDRRAFEVSERARARSLLELLARAETAPLSAEEIQRRVVDSGTVLLEYFLGEQRSYLWAVSNDGIASFELPRRDEIEKLARRLYASWSTRTAPDLEAARSLGKILLSPVAGVAAGHRLAVIAEGALQYIPFGALPLPAGEPLISAHEIITLPSASTLGTLRARTASRKPALKLIAVVADPVFTRDDSRVTGRTDSAPVMSRDLERSVQDAGLKNLERLYSTRREAKDIAALAPAQTRLEALDFDASRATVTGGRLAGYRIVHLATHGLLNSRRPELSGIVLSLLDRNGRAQDGFLRAQEVYGLKLNADLVVLSACQTALGREIQGEGLIGLTRGFMYAGSPRVIASLWRVPDRATSELMRRFYHGMLAGKLSAAAALRQAQLALSQEKQWASPYYWAGFTLQGEWR